MATTIYLVLLSVGIVLSWWVSTLVLLYSVVGLMLPTAPGYIGTIQAIFALALLPLAVNKETVLAASIIYNAIITLLPIALGIFILLFKISVNKVNK